MKKITLNENKGFTLVELMVVVGIIGILATIAIPNFRKYQAKSKTTEAKIQLSSVYTSMESMLLEYDTYATCLGSAGYNPSTEYKERYYGVGFRSRSAAQETTARNNGMESCNTSTNGECSSAACSGDGWFFFRAAKAAAGNSRGAVAATGVVATSMAQAAFTASAQGAISAGNTHDAWQINNLKKLVHIKAGY